MERSLKYTMRFQQVHRSLHICLILLIALSSRIKPSSVLLLAGAKSCVPVEPDHYICTDDPASVRHALHQTVPESFYGVKQRVDGTEAEQEAVQRVLQTMYAYFATNVLALPEYKMVRDKCKNKNELCAFWTSVGECDANRSFMVSQCPASCLLCLHLHPSFN